MKTSGCLGFLLLVVVLESSGCGYQKQIDDLNRQVAETNKQIGKLGENMVLAADKVDPIALKEIYRDVKSLQEVNEKLRMAIERGSGNAANVMVTPTSRTELELTGYSGTLRISAWVDEEKYAFISNQPIQASPGDEPELAVPWGIAHRIVEAAGKQSFEAANPGRTFTNWGPDLECNPVYGDNSAGRRFILRMASLRDEIDREYRSEVNAALGKYLANPFVIPSTHSRYHTINVHFHASGDHTIYLKVTPIKLDKWSRWSLSYRAYVVNTAGGEDKHDGSQFLVGTIDSSQPYELGKALPPEGHTFRVEVSNSSGK